MPVVERDEGVFTRGGVTRALCVLGAPSIVLGCAIVPAAFILVFLGSDFLRVLLRVDASLVVWVGTLVVSAPIVVLQVWRRCNRCRRRLFSDGRHYLDGERPDYVPETGQ